MSQRTRVVGARAPIIWLLIVVAVLAVDALVVGLFVIYPNYQRQQQVKQHYQAGIAFQNVEDWDKALAEFEQVIRIDATYKDTQIRLAQVKAKQRAMPAQPQTKAAEATATAQAIAATINQLFPRKAGVVFTWQTVRGGEIGEVTWTIKEVQPDRVAIVYQWTGENESYESVSAGLLSSHQFLTAISGIGVAKEKGNESYPWPWISVDVFNELKKNGYAPLNFTKDDTDVIAIYRRPTTFAVLLNEQTIELPAMNVVTTMDDKLVVLDNPDNPIALSLELPRFDYRRYINKVYVP